MKTGILAIAFLVATPAFAGENAEKAAMAKRAWSECVQTNIAKWSASTEQTEVLMRAAFGRCAPQQAAYRTAYRSSTRDLGLLDPAGDDEVDANVQQTQDAIKAEALASLLDARASTAKSF